MDIIQVTNPKFHPQTMRSILVANARHEIQLANQMRTLGYHRKNFLTKDERERKWLSERLAEMTTCMEASKAREEEERRERERRKADIYESRELNVDRTAADENAIQVIKKLIQAAMENPEPIQEVTEDRSQADSPTGDESVSVKSRASTPGRSAKLRSLQVPSASASRRPSPVSSSTSVAASEATESKDLSADRRRRRRSSAMSTAASPEVTAENTTTSSELPYTTRHASSLKLTRQLRNVVANIYGKGQTSSSSSFFLLLSLTYRFSAVIFCAIGGQHDGHLSFWLPSFVKLIMLLLYVSFVC